MYGLRFSEGDIDYVTNDLGELRDDLRYVREQATVEPSLFAGAVPVVQVGTSSADMQWETFEDARIEIPDWWYTS